MKLSHILDKVIYTTGISGFIGSHLLPLLLQKYDRVLNFEKNEQATIYQHDSRDAYKLSMKLINKNPARNIIHLAAKYQSNTRSLNDFRSLIESNVYFLVDIFENYLSNKDLEITNICSYMQLLDQSMQNAYSLSKEITKIFLEKNECRLRNIYLFDTFGSGDTRNKVTDVFIKKALRKEKIIIPENDVEINLTCAEDISLSIMKSLELKSGNYSIFSSNTMNLNELALMIGRLLNSEVEIVREGLGANNSPGSITMPPNILNKKDEIPIEQKIIERINELKRA